MKKSDHSSFSVCKTTKQNKLQYIRTNFELSKNKDCATNHFPAFFIHSKYLKIYFHIGTEINILHLVGQCQCFIIQTIIKRNPNRIKQSWDHPKKTKKKTDQAVYNNQRANFTFKNKSAHSKRQNKVTSFSTGQLCGSKCSQLI